jgi:hypothetical protein
MVFSTRPFIRRPSKSGGGSGRIRTSLAEQVASQASTWGMLTLEVGELSPFAA